MYLTIYKYRNTELYIHICICMYICICMQSSTAGTKYALLLSTTQ